jgi:outer membrane lipoprotein-sorting protein
MNMTRPFNPRALAIALASILTAPAALADTQFSAEMVQRGADGKSTTGQIAVGDGRLRTETVHQGQSLVRIGDEKRGVEWILFPDRKNYMERSTLGPDGKAMAKPTAQDPCAGMPGVSCQRKGEEQVSGRAALVWEITATQMGKTMSTTQWIDKERGPSFPLRQTMAGGGKMERVALGEEVLSGRKTEKWRLDLTGPDGKTMSTTEWYDPELKMAIKQEYPGGIVSELTSIQIGPQADEIFSIPAGYTRIEPPQPSAPAPRQ